MNGDTIQLILFLAIAVIALVQTYRVEALKGTVEFFESEAADRASKFVEKLMKECIPPIPKPKKERGRQVPEDISSELVARLTLHMNKNRVKGVSLAKEIGVSQSGISRFINTGRMSKYTYNKINNYLKNQNNV